MLQKTLVLFLFAVLMWLPAATAAPAADATPIPVENSKPLPKADRLGTTAYSPTEQEIPFLKKVNEPKIDLWGSGGVVPDKPAAATQPGKTGTGAASQPATDPAEPAEPKAYTLADQDGKYVGWFGIVRGNTWDEKTGQTNLLLEHKYFDGLTDLHIQIVSYSGAGDFHAVLKQKLADLPKLGLVRVYGKVAVQKDGTIQVTPEYMRVWDWGLFTFMDYGVDSSNPDWVKLRKVDGLNAYSPHPTTQFYEDRLGKR